MTTQTFPLGAVLTVTTGRLLCDLDDFYGILNHMTGDNLMTHQLIRGAVVCEPALLAQHPQLAEVEVPDLGDEAAILAFMAEQEKVYGTELPVEPLESWEHKDPIAELRELRPDMPIVVVAPESESVVVLDPKDES